MEIFGGLPTEILNLILADYANKMKYRNGVWMGQLKTIRLRTMNLKLDKLYRKWNKMIWPLTMQEGLQITRWNKKYRIDKIVGEQNVLTMVKFRKHHVMSNPNLTMVIFAY